MINLTFNNADSIISWAGFGFAVLFLMCDKSFSFLSKMWGDKIVGIVEQATHQEDDRLFVLPEETPITDLQLLRKRLRLYDLCEVDVSGDGNCQFRALSDQLYKSPDYHRHVRKSIVKQLKDDRKTYQNFVTMKYEAYCTKMAKSGEWGDSITLQAASDKFAVRIKLITSFRHTCFIDFKPLYKRPERGDICDSKSHHSRSSSSTSM